MDKIEANKEVLGQALYELCKEAASPADAGGWGQELLFRHWPAPGEEDDKKVEMAESLARLNRHYPSGMSAYVANAKKLLLNSKNGVNPYEGFTPQVPQGERLQAGTQFFAECEETGVKEAGHSAFVLVAGGLGERLGYNGIKVALPIEIMTGRCFLQHYCESILAFQARANKAANRTDIVIPLAIMTSADTHGKTLDLLQAHNNFGMVEEQITLVKQELVPALTNLDCHFAQSEDDLYKVRFSTLMKRK